MTTARKIVITSALLAAIFYMASGEDASANIPMGVAAELGATVPEASTTGAFSTTVTCAPSNSWNPDAGHGLVRCTNGYTSVNVESESTTPVYFFYRSVTNKTTGAATVTRSDYTTKGKKRCVGCNNGSSYQAEVTQAINDLFCVATSTTDAGVVVSVECAR